MAAEMATQTFAGLVKLACLKIHGTSSNDRGTTAGQRLAGEGTRRGIGRQAEISQKIYSCATLQPALLAGDAGGGLATYGEIL
jgi:hypothetical protein